MDQSATAPKIFIASSSEAKPIADALTEHLSGSFLPQAWYQDAFNLGDFIGKRLVQLAANFDFGVFVFTPDDTVVIKDKKFRTPRDNVVYELGLFAGFLGLERAILLWPSDILDIREMPDIAGLVRATYNHNDVLSDPLAATKIAASQIITRIEQSGLRGVQIEEAFFENWKKQIENASKNASTALEDLQNSVIKERTSYKGCNISVRKEDISSARTDVVVSSDDNFLSASGGVANAIASRAGHFLRNELIRRRTQRNKSGHLVITSSGDLEQTFSVIHAICIDFTFGVLPGEELVQSLVTNALSCAESMGARSITLPLIGAGTGNMDTDTSLAVTLKTTKQYLKHKSKRTGGLEEIKVSTIFDGDSFDRRALNVI
jgi:O-acetyl-ADP-ribose deacetylase (regulator of RNase III)